MVQGNTIFSVSRAIRKSLPLTAMLVGLTALGGCLSGGGIIPPPDEKTLPGTWVASEDDCGFYRISLNADGTGLLSAILCDDLMLYRIVSWKFGDKDKIENGEWNHWRELIVKLEPINGARPLQVTGWAGGENLRLNLAWREWAPRWARFSPEAKIEGMMNRTKDAMAPFEHAQNKAPTSAPQNPQAR